MLRCIFIFIDFNANLDVDIDFNFVVEVVSTCSYQRL